MKKYVIEDFICEPGYFHRTWQSCNWVTKDGKKAFHQRTYTPWMKDWWDAFWLDGYQESEDRLFEAIEARGLNRDDYYAIDECYGCGVFPATESLDTAIAYFNATYEGR